MQHVSLLVFAFGARRAVHCRAGCAHPQMQLLLMKPAGSPGSEPTSQHALKPNDTPNGNQCLKPITKANATL
jgi:hypothetical protein